MKARKMNSRPSLDFVRFGAVVLIALAALVLIAEGTESSNGYSAVSKPRTKIRQIRFDSRPRSLSTAIRFGKRDSSLRYSDADRYSPMMFAPQTDMPQKFPLIWFLQYLRSNPELANKAARELLPVEEDDDDEENSRSSGPRRYKKGSDSDDSYYLNK